MQNLRSRGRFVISTKWKNLQDSRYLTTQLKPIFFLPYPYLQYCNTNRYRKR